MNQSGREGGEAERDVFDLHVAVTGRLFKSPLWFTWCGAEQHIVNDEGRLARDEAADVAIRAVMDWLADNIGDIAETMNGKALPYSCHYNPEAASAAVWAITKLALDPLSRCMGCGEVMGREAWAQHLCPPTSRDTDTPPNASLGPDSS